jgi:phage-related protein
MLSGLGMSFHAILTFVPYVVQLGMKVITVKFYQSASENEPVKEWLKILCRDDKRIIGEDIKTVEYGWPLGMPLVRKLDKNLWEIRTHLINKEIARIFFTVTDGLMVLLHAFKKKSQSTPLNELEIAKKRRDQVLND